MAPQANYALARLSDAIEVLARHPGNLRQRLHSAAPEILLIPSDGLPDFQRVAEDILWVQDQLCRREPRFEGDSQLAASLHGMRDRKATEIVDRILGAEAKLDSYVNSQLVAKQVSP